MTEQEIQYRVRRVYTAFGDASQLRPEDFKHIAHGTGSNLHIRMDFLGGRTQEQLDIDTASIINEVMGIRDRAKSWLTTNGNNPTQVDTFIKSELSVALVHDLANTDKHGSLDRTSYSGMKPKLTNISRGMTLKYDPATGTYVTSGEFKTAGFDVETGEEFGQGISSGLEVVLTGEVLDESGIVVYELQKLLPDAIYKWEHFLYSLGLTLSL